MRYFSTHTIHIRGLHLCSARRARWIHTYTVSLLPAFFVCNIWYTEPEKRIRSAMGHSPRAAHRDILQKLRELFQLEITLFGFPFLLLFGNKNSFIVARREREGSPIAQRHPRPIQECLRCVLMHAEEHSSAFIKVKCSVTYSKRRVHIWTVNIWQVVSPL